MSDRDMNAFWQTLTLSTVPFPQWRAHSLLHQWVLAPVRQWRAGSLLMQWSEEIGAALVMLVFVLAPFIPNVLIGVLLAACGAYWLLLTLSDGEAEAAEQPALSTPIHALVLLYWGVNALAVVASPVRRAALMGLIKLSLYLLLFALMARVLRSPRIRNWVITVFLHVALFVSAYGWRQKLHGVEQLAMWVDPNSTLADATRVYSYLGNPNLLAAYLVPAVILSAAAVFAWRGWLPKVLAALMVVVNGLCLFWTYSRGGWLGLVIGAAVLALLLAHWFSVYLPRFWQRWALPLVLGAFAVLVVVAVAAVPTLRDRAASIFAGRGDSSNNFRINVWLSSIEMFKAYPVLGIGPGNAAFNQIYPRFQRARFSALSAYSVILEVAVETGIIGLTVFLWLMVTTFSLAWSALQRLRGERDWQGLWLIGAIATLVGILGHGLVDTVLYRPEVNTIRWLMMALIASYFVAPRSSVSPVEAATEQG